MSKAYLIVQRGPEIGKRYDLASAVNTVGRGDDNDIVLDDPYVSRYHAVFKEDGVDVVVVDLGSENPVQIKDSQLEAGTPYTLQHRDVVRMGQNIFSFQNPAIAPARPNASTVKPFANASKEAPTILTPTVAPAPATQAEAAPVSEAAISEPGEPVAMEAEAAPIENSHDSGDDHAPGISPGSFQGMEASPPAAQPLYDDDMKTGLIEVPAEEEDDSDKTQIGGYNFQDYKPTPINATEQPAAPAAVNDYNPVREALNYQPPAASSYNNQPNNQPHPDDVPTGDMSGVASAYHQSQASSDDEDADRTQIGSYNFAPSSQPSADPTIIGSYNIPSESQSSNAPSQAEDYSKPYQPYGYTQNEAQTAAPQNYVQGLSQEQEQSPNNPWAAYDQNQGYGQSQSQGQDYGQSQGYGQYQSYDQGQQQYGQSQSQEQSNPWQYGQSQVQPEADERTQAVSPDELNQANQGYNQYGQPGVPSGYGQYGQYGQQPQPTQAEQPKAEDKKEDDKDEKKKDDYDFGDAPTTIIKLDRPKQ